MRIEHAEKAHEYFRRAAVKIHDLEFEGRFPFGAGRKIFVDPFDNRVVKSRSLRQKIYRAMISLFQ